MNVPADNALDHPDRIERKTTASEVARVLRRRILSGFYPEDEFIRQEIVAQELGVSRIPVREALAQLESEGLVIRVKYRGALVPKQSFEEIEEIYELRLMLEPYLLQHSIRNITPEQIVHLRDIVERSRGTEQVTDWAGMNVDFHRALFEVARKPLALQTLDNLLMRADRYLKMQSFRSTTTKEESDEQHARILDRVEARDIEGAIHALREHISWNATDVRHSLPALAKG
ncbi:MAG: GntR family transcriptional regulator [Sphingomonadales bacterium]|nr:MAG: GntR family transcriptional regulator [Sphingomonadales bacterium]